MLTSTRLYSGVVAGAREALISGIPSLSISLNWWVYKPCNLILSFLLHANVYTLIFGVIIYCRRKDESQENDFKDAVAVCLPLINAAIRDIEKGIFPNSCFLNIEIPSSPLSIKVCVFEPLLYHLFMKMVTDGLKYSRNFH